MDTAPDTIFLKRFTFTVQHEGRYGAGGGIMRASDFRDRSAQANVPYQARSCHPIVAPSVCFRVVLVGPLPSGLGSTAADRRAAVNVRFALPLAP